MWTHCGGRLFRRWFETCCHGWIASSPDKLGIRCVELRRCVGSLDSRCVSDFHAKMISKQGSDMRVLFIATLVCGRGFWGRLHGGKHINNQVPSPRGMWETRLSLSIQWLSMSCEFNDIQSVVNYSSTISLFLSRRGQLVPGTPEAPLPVHCETMSKVQPHSYINLWIVTFIAVWKYCRIREVLTLRINACSSSMCFAVPQTFATHNFLSPATWESLS